MSPDIRPARVRVDAEDALLANLGARLLAEFRGAYIVDGEAQIWGGKSNLNKKIPGWNRGAPFALPRLVLRDLDSIAPPDGVKNCPKSETDRLLNGGEKSPNLLLRFAVAEAESWLLADGDALAEFMGVRQELQILQIPSADAVKNPKARIIALAKKSRRKEIRKGIPPESGSKRSVGIAYNAILTEFVRKRWNPKRAAKRSKILRRTLDRLAAFAGELPPR